MAKKNSGLMSMCKGGSLVSLLSILFLIISSIALKDAGFVVAIIFSAAGSLVALFACIGLIMKGKGLEALAVFMMVANVIVLLIYTAIAIYIFFVVPVAVNEMMNS